MTEQANQPSAEQEQRDLDKDYRPAERDSILVVRFMGNTARIADATFRAVDPFQLKSAAWWLERHAEKTLALAEIKEAEAQAKILRPTDMGSIVGPRDLRGGE